MRGIEPLASAWKAEVLPLYDTRLSNGLFYQLHTYTNRSLLRRMEKAEVLPLPARHSRLTPYNHTNTFATAFTIVNSNQQALAGRYDTRLRFNLTVIASVSEAIFYLRLLDCFVSALWRILAMTLG